MTDPPSTQATRFKEKAAGVPGAELARQMPRGGVGRAVRVSRMGRAGALGVGLAGLAGLLHLRPRSSWDQVECVRRGDLE